MQTRDNHSRTLWKTSQEAGSSSLEPKGSAKKSNTIVKSAIS